MTNRKQLAFPIQKALGERIRKLRTDKALSQKTLSELSKLSLNYIAQIEQGKRNVRLSTLKAIAQALNTKVSKLFEDIA